MRRRTLVGTVALALVALAGCAQAGPPGADASVEDLNRAFAACDYEPSHSVSPPQAVEFLAGAQSWLNVTNVVAANRDGTLNTETKPSTVVGSFAGSGKEEEVVLSAHFSFWPGVDWALSNSAQVWFAVADPTGRSDTYGYDVVGVVDYVLVVLPNGRIFLPGYCQRTNLYVPLAAALDGDLDEVLRGAPGLVGDDLRKLLRVPPPVPEEPAAEPVVILNPQDAPAELLASLRVALVHITLTEPLRNYVLATKIETGWNEGFPTDETAARTGYASNAYRDEGPLEIWLLDSRGDVVRPLALLGTIDIPSSLAGERGLALRVEIDVAGLTGADIASRGANGVMVDLVEAIPGDEFDINDPEWPALWEGSVHTEPAERGSE